MNWLGDRLRTGATPRGVWLTLGSSEVAELAALAGFEWALLDLEHGSGGEQAVLRQIQALSATATAPVVRLPHGASDRVHRLLDYGAAGLMAPMIDSAAAAEAFARALRYPPDGTRGLARSCRASRFGADPEYFDAANRGLVAMTQIETPVAVEAADAIAAVAGVDVLFLGHADLGLRLGCGNDPDAPALRGAEHAVLGACRRHGKAAGLLARSADQARRAREAGFTLIALGSDAGCVKAGLRRLLDND